ncbi:MAG: fasciclin domain-containing protein [Bacteroidota bacterium]
MFSPNRVFFSATFLFFFFLTGQAQHKSLNALPVGFYLHPKKSIAQTTSDAEEYTILSSFVKAADLEEILDQQGPFTIFAPSDNAFSKLPENTVNHLIETGNKKSIKAILTYHIVAGKLTASKILRALCQGEGYATFTTVHGTKIKASISGTDIVLIDAFGNSAKITAADSNQSNGVLHEIDRVVLPIKI